MHAEGGILRASSVARLMYPDLRTPRPQPAQNRCPARRLVSFELKSGVAAPRLSCAASSILPPTRWRHHSLAESAALQSHAAMAKAYRDRIGIGEGLIRLSVGLENAEDLVADLKQALE